MRIILALLALAFVAPPTPVFSAESVVRTVVTPEILHQKYINAGIGDEKVKILIMPGHEPTFGGTELGALKERNVVVEIAQDLAEHLRTNERFEVTVARDTKEWYAPLKKYFKKEWKNIQTFIKDKKKEWSKRTRMGDVEQRTFEVAHNTAAADVALRLYGINKWASEQGYDVVIHPHLNDNPGATNHSGFAVYVPDAQYANAEGSHALGTNIASLLNRFNATSTLAIENYGVVEDQDLIALGSYDTADFASVLIEYAYIYESKIRNSEARTVVLDDFAYQTYRGIQDFFNAPVAGDDTLALPYAWEVSPLPLAKSDPQVYALQAALHKLRFYPPKGELLIGCPISGYMGECTKKALKAFQASKGLEQTGTIGPKTKAALTTAGF